MNKLNHILTVALLVGVLLGTGCRSPRTDIPIDPITNPSVVDQVIPYVKPATVLVCSALINSTEVEKRVELAGKIRAVSAVVATLASGTTPTAEQLHAAIVVFDQGNPSWVNMVDSIKGIYELNFNKLNKDAKLALKILEHISLGCEQAAATYL